MVKVTIVQPYVPVYRVPFFSKLVEKLDGNGISCEVHAQRPTGKQALRRDSATPHAWHLEKATRRVSVGSISIQKSLTWREIRRTDAIIVGLLGSSPDTYFGLASRLVHAHKVGVWGHIDSYVAPFNRLDQWLERLQLRSTDHVFAYTPGGCRYALTAGVPASRITAVMNTVDTSELEDAVAALTPRDVDQPMKAYSLTPGKTFSFIGGLDASKRIDFLREVLDLLWTRDRDIRILIGGTGDQEALLHRAVARGQAVLLGRVGAREKALMAATSRAIVMPGRIGLVAVEALALNLEILSVRGGFHAPEVEYLEEGISLQYSEDNPDSFANLIMSVAHTPKHAHDGWKFPKLDDMVDNFHAGIIQMLES